MTRKRIDYPNVKNPDCEGTVFYDDEADPAVTYLHYVDFKRPGKKAVTECVAVENATGKKSIVMEPPPDFSKFAS